MSTILRAKKGANLEEGQCADLAAGDADAWETRVAVIQALIPLGLQAVHDVLQQEVVALAGPRYARGQRIPGVHRWTSQQGRTPGPTEGASPESNGCSYLCILKFG